MIKFEEIFENISSPNWIQKKISDIKYYLRYKNWPQDSLQKLWEVEELRPAILTFCDISSDFVLSHINELSYTLLNQWLSNPFYKIDEHSIGYLAKHYEEAKDFDSLSILWASFSDTLYKINPDSFYLIIDYSNERTVYQNLRRALKGKIFNRETFARIIKICGWRKIDFLSKEIYFPDDIIDELIRIYLTNDSSIEKSAFSRILRNLVIYDKCAEYLKTEILLII